MKPVLTNEFWCWVPGAENEDDGEMVVNMWDEDAAAEIHAESFCEGECDYGDTIVHVRNFDDLVKEFKVTVSMNPYFSATEIKEG